MKGKTGLIDCFVGIPTPISIVLACDELPVGAALAVQSEMFRERAPIRWSFYLDGYAYGMGGPYRSRFPNRGDIELLFFRAALGSEVRLGIWRVELPGTITLLQEVTRYIPLAKLHSKRR